MIGKTNCKAAKNSLCEKVNINIQSDSASFPGATFTVSYGSYNKTYTWDGSIMTIDIPAYVEYTISFDAVADFTTPASITNTAQAGNSITVDVTYYLAVEKVTVNVSADEGEVNGYEITIYERSRSNELPEGYMRLEYIESSGKQYIDTGIKPGQGTRTVMDADLLSFTTGVVSVIFGAYNDTDNRHAIFYQANIWKGWLSSNASNSGLSEIGRHLFEIKNGRFSIDENNFTFSEKEYSLTVNLYLLALNRNGSAVYHSTARLYSCQIYDNDVLIRDYVPALNQSGVAGLYDKANGVFYISSTSSDFSAGPELYNYREIAVQTSRTGTYKIPFGTEYVISANDIVGYNTPVTLVFTANQEVRGVNMVYLQKLLGVFIQDIYGNLYTEDEWNSTVTPNGIAVLAEECSFVMALEDAYTTYCHWSTNDYSIPNSIPIPLIEDKSIAITDYNGKGNSETILSYTDFDATAVKFCDKYLFPNGQKGYLGAAGEWKTVIDNISSILSVMSSCIGGTIEDAYYTSTAYTSNRIWYANLYNYDLGNTSIQNNKYVRAFTPYIANYNVINFYFYNTTYTCLEGMTWRQLCQTAFNNGDFYINNSDYVVVSEYNLGVVYNNGDYPTPDDLIISGHVYKMK